MSEQITITETINGMEIIETSAGIFEIGNVIIQFDGTPPLDTSHFDNNLNVTITTIQKLADAVDNLALINNAESVGDGVSIIKEISNKDLKLKSLKVAPGMSITDETTDLRVVIERIDGGTFN